MKGRDAWFLGAVVALALLVWAGTWHLERLVAEWRTIQAEVARLQEEGRRLRAIEDDIARYQASEVRLEELLAEADELLLDVPRGHPCLEEHLP